MTIDAPPDAEEVRLWVPVDPADVRKLMLDEGVDLAHASEYREYYFGAVDERRIVLGRTGRDLLLEPVQKAGPLSYFMYPYAEIDGQPVDWLAGQEELKYAIAFRAE